MPAGVVSSLTQPKINPRFLPAIDRVLVAGLRLGDAGKHEAINRVLKLVPEWKRGDCWRRIRQLRRSAQKPAHQISPPHNSEPQTSASSSPSSHAHSRTWTAEEDGRLLDWAGYEPVTKIALRLGRSVRAVRFRLGALGMSAKVSDGWSLRALRKLLRVSPDRLRHLIGSGMLRARDPRVTSLSLLALCSKNNPSLDGSTLEKIRAALAKHDAYSWDRAADLLGIPLEQLQTLISEGKLKVLDPFVTDRSFEELCRKHGDQINMSLIDPATAKWLVDEYGASNASGQAISRAQKHALVVRACKCGRKISGNVFFKHVRHCPVLKARAMAKAA